LERKAHSRRGIYRHETTGCEISDNSHKWMALHLTVDAKALASSSSKAERMEVASTNDTQQCSRKVCTLSPDKRIKLSCLVLTH
jgi:hypothetical protein